MRLKGLAGAVGKEVLNFPNLISETGFPVLNQTWGITKCYNWANYISVLSLSITEYLVLYFLCFFFSFFLYYFLLRARLIQMLSELQTQVWSAKCFSQQRQIPAHHSQSQVWGGGFVKRLGRKMFLCQLYLAAIIRQAACSIRIAFCVKHLIIRKWGLNVIL